MEDLCVANVAGRVVPCLDERFPDLEIELPDVARGYLMLQGAPLVPEREAVVLAAAGQSSYGA